MVLQSLFWNHRGYSLEKGPELKDENKLLD